MAEHVFDCSTVYRERVVGRCKVPDLDLELVVNLCVLASFAELELGGVCLSEVLGLPPLGRAVVEVPQLQIHGETVGVQPKCSSAQWG